MTIGNVRWDVGTQEWIIRGERRKRLVGRTSFDWATNVSYHYTGQGNFPGAGLRVADEWVAYNQELFGREDIVLAVFNEEGDWSPCPGDPPTCMFGQEPRDQRDRQGRTVGIWDLDHLRDLSARKERVTTLSGLNSAVIEYAFKTSHETGCIFDWVVDATLKHTDGVSIGLIDHVIRQTAFFMRQMQEKYPNAAFFFRARNEWNAHDPEATVRKVNLWAERFYRWKRRLPTGDWTTRRPGGGPMVSFTQPAAPNDGGTEWFPEQWPEGFCIVDGGGGNTSFGVDIGPEPGKYQALAFHQDRRRGVPGDAWVDPIEPGELGQMNADRRGTPLMNTENMYFVSMPNTEHWYRNPDGWNDDLEKQMRFYENNVPLTALHCVHDDWGKKAWKDWNTTPRGERWESALREFWGGAAPPIEPPDSWPPADPRLRPYDKWVVAAYLNVLGRTPDAEGRTNWNEEVEQYYETRGAEGTSISRMRDVMRMSDEFLNKNDGPWNYRSGADEG